ncbi:hypothetical protein AGMMS50293_25780 [Spirochaetia bacterium]|nr:hypothetical protein AGMMS50293_25780 [Spirochaetia bacterium]
MKNRITMNKIILTVLVTAIVLGGCSNFLNSPVSLKSGGYPENSGDAIPLESGKGQLSISISDGAARTLLPTLPVFSRFELVFTPNGEQNLPEPNYVSLSVNNNIASHTINLEPGSWTINAYGYTYIANVPGMIEGEYEVAVGSSTIDVADGVAQSISIILHINEDTQGDENGLFNYEIVFAEEAAVTEAVLKLIPLEEGVSGTPFRELDLLENADSATGGFAVPVGYYYLKVEVKNADDELAIKTDIVHIKKAQKTLAGGTDYTFTTNDFTPMRTLSGKLSLSEYEGATPDSASVYLYRAADHTDLIIPAVDVDLYTGGWSARISSLYTAVYIEARITYGEDTYSKDKGPILIADPTEEDLTVDMRFFPVVQAAGIEHGHFEITQPMAFPGATVRFEIVPDVNYRFQTGSLYYNANPLGDAVRTFTMPAEDVTLTVAFRPVEQKFVRGTGVETVYYETIQEIIEASTGSAEAPDEFIILEDINWDSGYTIPAGKHILLTVPAGISKLVKRAGTYTGSLFTVATGGSLTLQGNAAGELLIDGGRNDGKSASAALVTVNGTLTTKDNVTLRNNNSGGGYGGAVNIDNGTFNMQGGAITNNIAYHGGGVNVSGSIAVFTMTKLSVIQGNEGNWLGGGVAVQNGGLLDFLGGTIAGNAITYHSTDTSGSGYYYGHARGTNIGRSVADNPGIVKIKGAIDEGNEARASNWSWYLSIYFYHSDYYHIQLGITSFKIGEIAGSINNGNNTISLTLPYETDLSILEPEIMFDGTGYTFTGPFSYTNPATYTVSASDGTSVDYAVMLTKQSLATPGRPSIDATDANTFHVSWTAVNFATEYELFYKQGSVAFDEATFTRIPTLTNSSDITGLANSTVYSVYVRAKNGEDISAISSGAYASTMMPVPENLQVSPGAGELVVTWNAVSNARGYHIYSSGENDPSAANALYVTVTGGANVTTTISGLAHEETRYVWVRADQDIRSAWSGVVSGTTYKAVSDFSLNALVTAPVKNTVPLGPAVSREQYTGTLVWINEEDAEETVLFAPDTVYKAVFSLTAAANYTFTGADSFTYTGVGSSIAVSNNTGSTVTVTITFSATEPADNTGGIIIGGDPTAKLYMDGNLLTEGGTTIIPSGTGTYVVSLQTGDYSAITWYLNGNKVAEGTSATSITLTKRNKGNYVVNVEAAPVGGTKNSGSHTFVVQ